MGTLCLARVNTPQYFSTLNMRLKEFETSIVTGRDKGQNTDGTLLESKMVVRNFGCSNFEDMRSALCVNCPLLFSVMMMLL